MLNEKTLELQLSFEQPKKKAFLIHSSKPEEKPLLYWFMSLLCYYGTIAVIIDPNPQVKADLLKKSLDAIADTNFVISFLTSRYQCTDETGKIIFKAPDKCYDEIAMSYAKGKEHFALVEENVDSGRVLHDRTWVYRFKKTPTKNAPITADTDFFKKLWFYAKPYEEVPF